MIYDEGHYAGVAVFGRISDQGKTSDHLAVHDIVGCAAFRVRSLFGDDLIVVAVIRRTALVGLVALLRRLREQLAERALLVALRDRPVKPVLLAGIADEVLGIDARARAGAVLFGVFILGVDIGKTNLDGVELVAADPPVENFATTLLGIDEIAARAPAAAVERVRLTAFVISAFLIGAGGSLYAQFLGILTADTFFMGLTFITLAMLVIGGIGSLSGAVVGTVAVALIIEILRGLEGGVIVAGARLALPAGSQEIGLGMVMALILIFRAAPNTSSMMASRFSLRLPD